MAHNQVGLRPSQHLFVLPSMQSAWHCLFWRLVHIWCHYQPLWWCDSLGQSGKRVELLLMAEWPNGEVASEQNCLRPSCSLGSPHFGLSSGSLVDPNWVLCNPPQLHFALHTSFRQKCLKLRCHDFSALADWCPKQTMSSTLHAWQNKQVLTWYQTYLSIICLIVSRLFLLGAYI